MIQNLDSTKPGAGQSLHETQCGSVDARYCSVVRVLRWRCSSIQRPPSRQSVASCRSRPLRAASVVGQFGSPRWQTSVGVIKRSPDAYVVTQEMV